MDKDLEQSPAGQEQSPEEQKKQKTGWQATKEGWYDKIPLTLKQLDIIVGVCWALLILTFAAILLDAFDILNVLDLFS